MQYGFCFFALLFWIDPLFSQAPTTTNSPGIYQVGYQSLFATDSTRIYKPRTSKGQALHYRPLELDLWYPAAAIQTDRPMEFGQFIDLLQTRSNRFQNDTIYQTMTADVVQYLCANLQLADTAQLIHLLTGSYPNAVAVKKRFPLIVYMCSYNGISFENLKLFETLASHGYLVASITSVGRYPGNMSTSPADLMEQVFDGQFAMDLLASTAAVDTANMGVIGYSWGGLAALVLTMTRSDLKCLLSLDGSEMHYYGASSEEDKDFDQLRSAPVFQCDKVGSPYGYLESGYKQTDRKVDSIFNIIPGLAAPRQYLRFNRSTHEDFAYISSLARDSSTGGLHSTQLYNRFCQLSLDFVNRYLTREHAETNWALDLGDSRSLIDSAFPVAGHDKMRNHLTLSGKVIDEKNKAAIAYVNVGIPGKDLGTVSQQDGTFLLSINQQFQSDSVRFSIVGYQQQTYPLAKLLQRTGPIVILLRGKPSLLKEVIVRTNAPALKRIGNTTSSKFISVGFPLRLLGGETGVKMNLGKRPVWLRHFNFNIASNRLDSAVFRLNLYQFDRGVPSVNILTRNILVRIGKQIGGYSVDLSDYKLMAKGDILVSLEWVQAVSAAPENAAIFFSAGFLNSATWHRQTSQASWKKLGGIGAGFNLVVQAAAQPEKSSPSP
jgi:pimeloyl-ACP methyl ester carboxylesterase